MKTPPKKSKLTVKQKKTQRTVIIVLILVVIVALYFKFRTPKEDPGTPGTTSNPTGSNTGSGMKRVGNDTILEYGTNAEEVKWVQSGYNAKYAVPMGMTKLVVDGKFGTKTQNAVKFATGKTTTSWTAFKAVLDNKILPTSQNSYYGTDESVWPWETES